MELEATLKSICTGFRIEGEFVGFEYIKEGNVNHTYKVNFRNPDGSPKSYIVQQVNTYAFRRPEQLMHNIDLITEHIRSKKQGRIALHFHHTGDRKTFIYDDAGNFWRMCNYIPSITYNVCSDIEILRHIGEAFGEFQMLLSDVNVTDLYETIPDFHNTPKRLETLFADADRDPCGRAHQVGAELEYIASVRQQAEQLTRLHEQGRLPLRVTHNDTKINNVLFDRTTPLAVVDLDTVMPGLVGHDFGDGVRFSANYVAEDSPHWQEAGCDLGRFQAFTEGFLSQTAGILTPLERDTLALSVFSITVELASRFLDDYLLGDPYFKIDYPDHNLVRTRCQLALAKDVLRKLPQMERIVADCWRAALPAS